MKKHLPTMILITIFCIGLSLLLYPGLSDYWNSYHQSRAVSLYAESVDEMDQEACRQLLERARQYNERIAESGIHWQLSEEEKREYEDQLKIDSSGIMAYIEIPKINCSLPVYHGTDEGVLQVAVGHLEGTSLPVGGESTHCVLSGHRGLPSAKLFTNLDKMDIGDVFAIRTLNEVLTYEVDQILIVLPDELNALQIEEGKDYCTLVTCTPYGINTHRLLVRGHRIESEADGVRVTSDALQVEPVMTALVLAIPLFMFLVICFLVMTGRKKKM